MTRVSELVKIDLSEVIDLDLEGFIDTIAERAGYPLLMDVNYEVEGCEDGGTLQLRVTGEVEDREASVA